MKAKIFLTGLALVAVTAFSIAQNQDSKKGNGNGTCNGTAKCAAFVDVNKNGVCDTFESPTANVSARNGNRNGNGNCDGTGKGKGQGKGKNFVDANNNGICDTYEASVKK